MSGTAEFIGSPTAYRIALPEFEGPLDLLLHLIKKNEVDILNIPIAPITEQYLAHLALMEALDVSVAGEYLVMAATLIHIKSKMLLPQEPEASAEEDPRADLVRQLMEYEQFKRISAELGSLEARRRDLFPRPVNEEEFIEEQFVEATLFDLLKAFQRMVVYLPQETLNEIAGETFSVTQKMNELLDALEKDPTYHWRWEASSTVPRGELIAMFLAVLELVRLKLVRAFQSSRFGDIHLTRAVEERPEHFEWTGESNPGAAAA